MRDRSFHRPVHQALLVVFISMAVLAGLLALYTVKWVFLAALIGIGLGVLIAPASRKMRERFRIPRTITSLLLLLLFFGVFFTAGYFLISMISDQILPLMQKLPGVLHDLQGKLGQFSAKNPWMGKGGANVDLQKYASGALGTAVEGLKFGASAVGGLVFIFFVALYLSIRPAAYLDGFVSAFPAHMRMKTRDVLQRSGAELRRWFWAQLTAMLTVGIVASIALKIVGSDYWIFFGCITAVLELVPYFGSLTAFVTVCVITLAASPDAILKTAIAFLVVLNLEGNVIIPLIMKGRVDLRPIHLLILMTIMGEWFGVFGFLMAAPALAVLRTFYIQAYLPRVDEATRPPDQIPPSQAAA